VSVPAAHLGGGHWYEWLIYFTPLLVIIAMLALEMQRQKRSAKRESSKAPERDAR
jgi:hypothetical protein